MAERLFEAWSALPFAVVAGGVLGAIEGVALAFPLTVLPGLFGDRTAAQAEPQP